MMERTNGFTPALGFHVLTPLYDRVVTPTTREQTFKNALLEQAAIEAGYQDCLRAGTIVNPADWGRAGGLLSRTAFLTIQLLDGFDNTGDDVAPVGAARALC